MSFWSPGGSLTVSPRVIDVDRGPDRESAAFADTGFDAVDVDADEAWIAVTDVA